MANGSGCFKPVLGKRIRVTEVDECGTVVEDVSQKIVTDGFVAVTLSPETEDGEEITQKNASGGVCINEKLPDSFKRFTVDIEFCGVNASLLAMVTNAEEYEDYASEVAGVTVPEGNLNSKFALELWMGLAGVGCEDAGEASGYLLLPKVQAGTLDDIEVTGEDAVTFKLTGAYTVGGNNWDVGPYNVVSNDDAPAVDAPLPEALDPYDHLLILLTNVAPPESACEPTVAIETGGGV